MDLQPDQIESALTRVGELVAFERERHAVVILGGAALNLLGIVERSTLDVDILAFADREADAPVALLREPPTPMPPVLRQAIADVGRSMSLDPQWMNTAPALALAPTDEELDAASDWIRPQNASPEFHEILHEVVAHVRRQLRGE